MCNDFLFNGHPAARFVDLHKTTYICANFRTSSDELSDLDA